MTDRHLRLLVCGDRNWTDGGLIGDWLSMLRGDNPDMELCHGANGVRYRDGVMLEPIKSADAWAAWMAQLLDIPTTAFPAEWEKYGKRAGPIRNRQPPGTKPNKRRLPKPGRNRPAKGYDPTRRVWAALKAVAP